MRVPYTWLKEFIDLRLDPEDLVHRFTMAGVEVEALEGEGEDTVFDLAIFPNRGDLLSVVGVAREVAALLNKPLKLKQIAPPKGVGPIQKKLWVRVVDAKRCLRYSARLIEGISIGGSPEWLAGRLRQVGLRPVNNVVDATNYVMWELGQPLHAFDARLLNRSKIIVKSGFEKEKVTLLDRVARESDKEDLFICDGLAPVALAGVMGAANSEVRENTTSIVLESACFDPISIRRTSKRLGLISESSRRFERGVDLGGTLTALHRVTDLIVEIAGGTPTANWIDIYPKRVVACVIALSEIELERILGVRLSILEIRRLLKSLGLEVVSIQKRALKVRIPTFRRDLTRPIDLIEECARLAGFEGIPSYLPSVPMRFLEVPKERDAQQKVRNAFANWGWTEVVPLHFVSGEAVQIFSQEDSRPLPLANPLSGDGAFLRNSILPNLLDSVRFNQNRQRSDVKLFELGTLFYEREGKTCETKKLVALGTGNDWSEGWTLKARPLDLFTLKGLAQMLGASFGLPEFKWAPIEPCRYLTPLSQKILCGENLLGWAGELSKDVLKIWELETPCFALEIDWESWFALQEKAVKKFAPIPSQPFVERDLSIVVDRNIRWEEILQLLQSLKIPWICQVQLFDRYEGEPVPKGRVSLAFRVRLAKPEKTFTDAEIKAIHEEIVAGLKREFRAELR